MQHSVIPLLDALNLQFRYNLTTMADTDEISTPRNIQLNDILGVNNTNGTTALDLTNDDDLSDFGTPRHTLDNQKTPNTDVKLPLPPPHNPELREPFSQKRLRMITKPVLCLQLFPR
jgi:hypothetical protein